MQTDNFALPLRRRAIALAAAAGLHVALFAWWRLAQAPAAPDPGQAGPVIQWIRTFATPPVVTAQAQVPTKPRAAPARGAATPAGASDRAPPAPPAPAESIPVDTFADQAAPSLRERALRDAGAIDKALRKESPGNHIGSPHSSPQSRLAAGIDAATRAPRVWEAPVIIPVADQGQNGRRIYKVVTGLSTYCIYVDANHTPSGIDMMQKGITHKIASCPRES